MTKNELLKIVNAINANWPINNNTTKQDVLNLWWTCLGDLDFHESEKVINAILIEARQWRPSPGEIRKRIIDGEHLWPDPESAWVFAQGRQFAADIGIDVPNEYPQPGLAEALSEAMRASRGQGKHGFMAAWAQVTGKRYALPTAETDSDGVQLDDH